MSWWRTASLPLVAAACATSPGAGPTTWTAAVGEVFPVGRAAPDEEVVARLAAWARGAQANSLVVTLRVEPPPVVAGRWSTSARLPEEHAKALAGELAQALGWPAERVLARVAAAVGDDAGATVVVAASGGDTN